MRTRWVVGRFNRVSQAGSAEGGMEGKMTRMIWNSRKKRNDNRGKVCHQVVVG